MNIYERIFEREKKKLLGNDIRYTILSLQYYINKNEDLYIVYNIKDSKFLFYHGKNFTLKSKNERIIYILKKGVKKEVIDYTDIYNYILLNFYKNKEEIKEAMIGEIDIKDEEFDDFYNDLQILKKERNINGKAEDFIINLSIKNKTFFHFLEKILHIEYIMEKHSSPKFRILETYFKKLKYEDILKG